MEMFNFNFENHPIIFTILGNSLADMTSLYPPPPAIQHEVPPQVDDILAGVEPWILYNLQNTFASDVHYENQLYGSITTFLLSIFPARRRYMIIPQGILRRVMAEDEFDDESENAGDISIGSTGAVHESRHLRMLFVFSNIHNQT